MSALTILGYCCLILFFMAIPISIIYMALKNNPDETPSDEEVKRELEESRVIFWEYFILIIPVILIAIGLLSNDFDEKQNSLVLVGVGLSGLLVSPYNNRFDIKGVNILMIAVCALCALTSVYLSSTNYVVQLAAGYSCTRLFWYPLSIYLYLRIVREIIYEITGTYPLTVDRSSPIGSFFERHNRKANYWDLLWTMWNLALCCCLLILPF
jgi:hypothetical protein